MMTESLKIEANALKRLEMDFQSLACIDEFFSSYPKSTFALYQIARDLYIKNQDISIRLLDAVEFGYSGYIIEKRKGIEDEFYLPISIDDDIDLNKLLLLTQYCTQQRKGLLICIYTKETIIYQRVSLQLP
mmetsp:Transcript_33689/g.34316  ORF Transcript_33689/g.34316 Transcript_33689/m.34316 type:complete len:131 (-) Transcript_33689:110-502(-)